MLRFLGSLGEHLLHSAWYRWRQLCEDGMYSLPGSAGLSRMIDVPTPVFHSSRKSTLPQGTPTSLNMSSNGDSCNTRVNVVAVDPRCSCSKIPETLVSGLAVAYHELFVLFRCKIISSFKSAVSCASFHFCVAFYLMVLALFLFHITFLNSAARSLEDSSITIGSSFMKVSMTNGRSRTNGTTASLLGDE